jgi:hypothetical protein
MTKVVPDLEKKNTERPGGKVQFAFAIQKIVRNEQPLDRAPVFHDFHS